MEDERSEKQHYLRKEIIDATGELKTGQQVFKTYESKDFKAQNSNIPVIIEFKNVSKAFLTYFYLDENKKRCGSTKLQPASFGTMDTFVNNPWVIEGPTGLIATYIPTMDVREGEIITVSTDKDFVTTAKKDVSKFVDFMASSKPNGDDVDNWNLEELKEMVSEYQNQGQRSIINDLCKYNILPSDINNLQTIVSMPNTLNPTDMLLKNIDVKMIGTRKIDGGRFHKDYVVYAIKTMPYEWSVERRFSDFLWLRETLDQDFPFTFVPQIPDKELNSKDADVVSRRRNWLQMFLNSVADHPELKSTPHVQGFLRLHDPDSYEKFKKSIKDSSMKQRDFITRYEKERTSLFDGDKGIRASDFSTLSQKGHSDVKPEYTSFMTDLTKYITVCKPCYNAVDDYAHQLVDAVDNLREVSEKLSGAYKALQNATKTFNESTSFGICETLEHTYSTSASIFLNWANNLDRRKDVIQKSLVNLVDYSKKELETADENVKFRNKLGNDFVEYYKRIHGEKHKLFKGSDIRNWQLSPEVASHIPNNVLQKDEELAKALILHDKTKS